MTSSTTSEQLAAVAALHREFQSRNIDYWLFGGWAVDFHCGRVTREHGDLDVAVWHDDRNRVAALLENESWLHTPEAGEDGYTCYERRGVRLEVAFLARDDEGDVYTPLREGRGEWPNDAFGDEVVELRSVHARVIRLDALVSDKSVAHADALTAEKDRADVLSLFYRSRTSPTPAERGIHTTLGVVGGFALGFGVAVVVRHTAATASIVFGLPVLCGLIGYRYGSAIAARLDDIGIGPGFHND